MKGIIFNLLERVVSDKFGGETWDRLLDDVGLEGAYTSVGSYPDEQLNTLVASASKVTGLETSDLIRWFGRTSMPLLVERYPDFFVGHASTRSFLLTLNDVIHPEVRKLFPGAYAPSFEFDDSDPETLILAYISHRNLCSFAEGLIEGAADHFGEEATVDQTECAKRGGNRCVFQTRFRSRVG